MGGTPLEDVERHAARIAELRQELQAELERRDEAIRSAKVAGFRAAIIREKAGADGVPMSGAMYHVITGGKS